MKVLSSNLITEVGYEDITKDKVLLSYKAIEVGYIDSVKDKVLLSQVVIETGYESFPNRIFGPSIQINN
jgi:hypothetical protein